MGKKGVEGSGRYTPSLRRRGKRKSKKHQGPKEKKKGGGGGREYSRNSPENLVSRWQGENGSDTRYLDLGRTD